MQPHEIKLQKSFAPHLRGAGLFESQTTREFTAVAILAGAAVFFGGAAWLRPAAVVFGVAFATEILLRAVKLAGRSFPDLELIRQLLLFILFLPAGVSAPAAAFSSAALVLLHRLSGGKAGRLIQPACFALALLYGFQGTAFQPVFALVAAGRPAALTLFLIWLALRFPRGQTEALRMLFIFSFAAGIFLLHETSAHFAFLWAAAASDLFFDPAIEPLTVRGRLWHLIATACLFLLLLAAGTRSDAVVLTGLISGFLAAWIEKQTIARVP